MRLVYLMVGLLVLFVSLAGHAKDDSDYPKLVAEQKALIDSWGYSQEQKRQLRLIVLAPHLVENLYAIGAGEQIVGTTDSSDYPEQALNILRIGNYAALLFEKIISIKPDVIVAWQGANPEADLARLAQAGVRMIYSKPQAINDVALELKLLGYLTGRAEQSQQAADSYLQKVTAIKAKYQHAKPVSVFYELWSNPLTSVGSKAWPMRAVALCGLESIFANAHGEYPQVSPEQVIINKPQVIIQPTSSTAMAIAPVDWSAYAMLPAVKNKMILTPNADFLHRTVPRIVEEIERVCSQINTFRARPS